MKFPLFWGQSLSLPIALSLVLQPVMANQAKASESIQIEELELDQPDFMGEDEVLIGHSEDWKNEAQEVLSHVQKASELPKVGPSKCYGDFQKYKKRLGWKVALTLPITAVAAYAGGALLGGASVAIGRALGANYQAFEDLAVFLGVFIVTAGATAATGIGLEISAIGKLIASHQMIRLIEESRNSEQKFTQKWIQKFEKRFPDQTGKWTIDEFKELIRHADETGDLCNGIMKQKKPRRISKMHRLKNRLAMPSDLLAFLSK